MRPDGQANSLHDLPQPSPLGQIAGELLLQRDPDIGRADLCCNCNERLRTLPRNLADSLQALFPPDQRDVCQRRRGRDLGR